MTAIAHRSRRASRSDSKRVKMSPATGHTSLRDRMHTKAEARVLKQMQIFQYSQAMPDDSAERMQKQLMQITNIGMSSS